MPLIQNWDDTEALLHHCFYNELRVAPEEHPTLLILPSSPFTSKAAKEKLTQIMFETYSVPAFYLGDSSVLSVLATGSVQGLVIDSGHANTYVVPVIEATSIPDASLSTDLAGLYLDERLIAALKETGHELTGSSAKYIVQDIKAKSCYVAEDFSAEYETKTEDFSYEMPDGQIIKIQTDRFKTPEVLFDPSRDGFYEDGVVRMAVKSILKCDKYIQNDLYQNVVLTGGTTLLRGYPERFRKDLKGLVDHPVKVVAPPERGSLAWIGGSILTSLSSFEKAWITKEDYDEIGPAIVHQKCSREQ